jgi:hypothetical protein
MAICSVRAAARDAGGRVLEWTIARFGFQPLTRTVDANCAFRIKFPKRDLIAARHGDYGGRSSRPGTQPQMRIKLRRSARPGRPAPSARTDMVDMDF